MFTTYSASAGSGKTTHLVADYIALCFHEDSRHVKSVLQKGEYHLGIFQKILAITFTNNAAAEMKERIVQTLREFAYVPKAELSARGRAIYNIIVLKLFDQTTLPEHQIEEFMQRESRALLRNIIYDYARFTLTTIDSFFQRIIRSAALFLKLDLNFSVQIDLNEFYIKAIDQLLTQLSSASPLAQKLLFMLNKNIDESGKLDIDHTLKSIFNILYSQSEVNYEPLQTLKSLDTTKFQTTIQKWKKEAKALPSQMKKDIAPYVADAVQWIDTLTFSFNSDVRKWFYNVSQEPVEYFRESFEEFRSTKTGSFFRKKTLSASEQELADDVLTHIIDDFNQIFQILQPLRKRYLDVSIYAENAEKLPLIFDLQEKMNELKKRDNFFILNETNTFIYENIKDREIPEIFDQIKFDHFFIDEFQDTSIMQWRDLLPLITNRALASNGQVTLFGDVKQAIYRFRNGDAQLFYNLIDYDRMQQNTPLRSVDRNHYSNVCLSHNYRSSKAVTFFNNEFYRHYSTQLDLSEYYADVVQEIHREDLGLVQLFFQRKGDDNSLLRTPYHKDETIEQYIQNNPTLAVSDSETFRAISEALARGYQYGDIAILYSGNDKCKHISQLLLELNIPVVTDESLLLNASPAVNLLIYTMKYLLHPDDKIAQATILFYLSQLHQKETCPCEQLSDSIQTHFHEAINTLLGKPLPTRHWLSLPLLFLVKEMTLFYQLNSTKDPFIVDFMNVILKYVHTHTGEIAPFLLWWQQLIDTHTTPSLTLPTEINAIKVCTIHKSKGLEYPVVILPYSSSKQRDKSIWTTTADHEVVYFTLRKKIALGSSYESHFLKEERDRKVDLLNTLYVAHTRARDVLIVITSEGSEESYGKTLLNYIQASQQNKQQILHFEQDEEDDRFYYLGDKAWKNPATPKKYNAPITPNIAVSTFHINDIATHLKSVNYSSTQIEIGNFVHKFLAQLSTFPQTMDEVASLIANIEETKRTRLQEAFKNILSNAEWHPYFSSEAKVLNEMTILDTEGEAHRPDRIVFLDNKVVVIDYKTGQPHSEYQKQIDLYCNLLMQMGHANVEGILIYI